MKWGGYDSRKGGTVKAAENYALQFLLLHCSLRPVWLLIAERKRQSEAVWKREREWEQGTVCIVCALFGRFRVNVNYQNCFGTWLTDSKPKAIKIFMTHWVITSNPQTWVMPRPLPQCLPRTIFYCSRARSKDVRNFRELKGKIYAQRPKENVKRRRTTGDIKKIYCFMISSSSRRLHKKKKKGSRNCNCFLPVVALRS